jgi:hypothetical protein
MARVGGQFSSSGRYGSPAMAGTAAGAISSRRQSRLGLRSIIRTFRTNSGYSGLGEYRSSQGRHWPAGSWKHQLLHQCSADHCPRQSVCWQYDPEHRWPEYGLCNQRVINAANQDPWTKAQNLAQITGGIGQLGGTSSSQGISYGQGTATKKEDPGVFGDILAGVGAGGQSC